MQRMLSTSNSQSFSNGVPEYYEHILKVMCYLHAVSHSDLRQATYTCVSLQRSSITWYQSKVLRCWEVTGNALATSHKLSGIPIYRLQANKREINTLTREYGCVYFTCTYCINCNCINKYNCSNYHIKQQNGTIV